MPLSLPACPFLLCVFTGFPQLATNCSTRFSVLLRLTLTLPPLPVLDASSRSPCRYRRQRGRRGPSKSSSDLTNGVIYEDLPSGPTPRVVPAAHGHPRDTHTLAPMEVGGGLGQIFFWLLFPVMIFLVYQLLLVSCPCDVLFCVDARGRWR